MGKSSNTVDTYRLASQVGFNLRRASQRHVAIFNRHVDGMTPRQFAVLARLYELGPLSQNKLGRLTAMDSATIKGVVERLMAKDFLTLRPDPNDQRLRIVELTPEGQAAFTAAHDQALEAREETLEPLTASEAETLEAILAKLV